MAFIRGTVFASVALLLVVVASVAEGHRPELTERDVIDASILLQNPWGSNDERDIEPNKSIDSFDVIDNMKSELEQLPDNRLLDHVDNQDGEAIDPYFAAQLQHLCDQNDKRSVPFDERTPMKFDNAYYQDLLNKRGLLTSDQTLYTPNTWADELVNIYANNQEAFFADFKISMVNMGNMSPPDWMPAEVRLKCSVPNY
ncbi:hypothetical protein GUJ93_ZPchr0006g45842 [Zizania palustris]|uniref:Plant heme peroxidase family profile domain-containing protein n=1 Tax=Zizania palustris TaxID=103762 RepID=A0A8J5VL39_ZIZPA|nr:hypothetical protein GUJ93_ZPchr0006g45842 [Zizania palustris]